MGQGLVDGTGRGGGNGESRERESKKKRGGGRGSGEHGGLPNGLGFLLFFSVGTI